MDRAKKRNHVLMKIEKNSPESILDAVHHYWESKGYIRDEHLFLYIDFMMLKRGNPFKEDVSPIIGADSH